MKVRIYHNLSRDASFGLNTAFRRCDDKADVPEGVRALELDKNEGGGKFYSWTERTPRRHPLVLVHEYDTELTDTDRLSEPPYHLLEHAFAAFNNGSGREDPAYFDRKLRSLSVGDVVAVDGRAYACESAGWKRVSTDDLRVLTTRSAKRAIRAKFGFRSDEPLTITVPLEVT